jgi:FkbM family methyltransferase
MLEPLLAMLKRSLNGLGLEVSRRRDPLYRELLDAERYVERVVDLMGREFHIADSLSFFWNYQDIFVKDIYRFVPSRQPPYILDCGANAGLSVVYFKTLFPQCEIVAVEPDPAVFRLLERNVQSRGLDRVVLLEKAITGSSGRAAFFREGADGGRCHPLSHSIGQIDVDTISLDALIDRPIDFLKMDIEGAECDAILSSKRLKMVDQLFIEYHSFEDSPQTLGPLLDKLWACGFRYYLHTQFCSRRPLVDRSVQLGMDLQIKIFGTRDRTNALAL